MSAKFSLCKNLAYLLTLDALPVSFCISFAMMLFPIDARQARGGLDDVTATSGLVLLVLSSHSRFLS